MKEITFTKKEREFLDSNEAARLATSHNDIPHVKPVSYIFYQNKVYVVTDYYTRSFKNISENKKIAIAIDQYKPNGHKAVCIQGTSTIIEKGDKFSNIFKMFYDRFDWVKNEPWEEGEAPFIEIIPVTKTSWGVS